MNAGPFLKSLLRRSGILGYDTGDFPGEIGVLGDSTTGERFSRASLSSMPSSSEAPSSIVVAES
jgi:hypothetical protein